MEELISQKKELIQFQFEKKQELGKMNQEFFIEKQKIMSSNTEILWGLKNKYQDKTHTNQLERMELAMTLKIGRSKI